MVIIMTSLIIMMIRMQMVAAELMMMMIMKVMCVSYDDVAGRGKNMGTKIHTYYACREKQSFAYLCWTGGRRKLNLPIIVISCK